MKTLFFHINVFLAGDIETELIELLSRLDPAKYKMRLSITYSLGGLEVLKKKIPPYVQVIHLLDEALSETRKKQLQKSISLTERIYDTTIQSFIKKIQITRKIKELVKDADVVIDFDMSLAPYAHLLGLKKKVAYCHFSPEHYHDNKWRLNKLAGHLKKYDKVVLLCEEMKDKAAELYPSLKNKLLRIYSAIDNAKIQRLAAESLGGYDYLLEDGYFVSVGRLAESQKDFTMLIKGFAACVKKYDIRHHLAIVGDGYSRLHLEELAIDEGVGELVTFAGYQPNHYKWIRNSKFFSAQNTKASLQCLSTRLPCRAR